MPLQYTQELPADSILLLFSSGADSNTLPIRTWNHRGLENGGDPFGACGSNMDYGRNYTKPSDWVTPNGSSVPFLAQATYTEGEEVVIRSWTTANHRGHIEMYGCGDYENPTDACFRQHPLVFVEDMLHGAPKDPAYPLRAMLAPPSGEFEVQCLHHDINILIQKYTLWIYGYIMSSYYHNMRRFLYHSRRPKCKCLHDYTTRRIWRPVCSQVQASRWIAW